MIITKEASSPVERSDRRQVEVRRPFRISAAPAVVTLALSAALFLLASCAKNDPVAGLTELPREATAGLQDTPGSRLLATKVQEKFPAIPPRPPSAGLCPQDGSTTFFDAQVRTPITVCMRPDNRFSLETGVLAGPDTREFKLTDLSAFTGLANGVLWQPPLLCKVSNGPWAARITVDRLCIFTCSPVNQLTVIGVPNNVQFVWLGRFQDHPAGFEFVGTPTETDSIDFGPCNGEPKNGGQPLHP